MDFSGSVAFSTTLGALLAGLIGIGTVIWQRWSERRRARKALGSLLYMELTQSTPDNDPVSNDPPTARLLSFVSVSQLLTPGLIDPECEKPLFRDLVFLSTVVEDFNDKAKSYNAAWASGAARDKLQLCYNDLQMSNRDYRDAHRSLMANITYLGDYRSLNEPAQCPPIVRLHRMLKLKWRMLKSKTQRLAQVRESDGEECN